MDLLIAFLDASVIEHQNMRFEVPELSPKPYGERGLGDERAV
jgi:hypothetical protein